jgi:cytochrome oxidase assembly protein ShyY1
VIVIAHVAGVPVEELIPTVAGAGSMVLLARGWVSVRVRRYRRRGT